MHLSYGVAAAVFLIGQAGNSIVTASVLSVYLTDGKTTILFLFRVQKIYHLSTQASGFVRLEHAISIVVCPSFVESSSPTRCTFCSHSFSVGNVVLYEPYIL